MLIFFLWRRDDGLFFLQGLYFVSLQRINELPLAQVPPIRRDIFKNKYLYIYRELVWFNIFYFFTLVTIQDSSDFLPLNKPPRRAGKT